MTKNEIRSEVRSRITAIDKERRNKLDTILYQQFRSIFIKIRNKSSKHHLTVLSYMPLLDEPNVTNLFVNIPDITLVLPVSLPNGRLELRKKTIETATGLYGITEPTTNAGVIQPNTLDLALIPGRAFTPAGDRLGRGKGYYDRLLSELSCPTVAIAYDLQLYPHIPTEAHDRKVDVIITERATYSETYL